MTQPKLNRGKLRPKSLRTAEWVRVVTPSAKWSDLALPAAQTKRLQQMVAQVKAVSAGHPRGSALFAGDDGAGRNLAARLVASTLGLPLHRVDLTAVVSKYIGETEKNLRRLFDAAATVDAVLLLDEADALFGKRSGVKDSHDRYANIEVNYLLQRMEAHQGVVILATNAKANLDPAFLRRLRYIVKFPTRRPPLT